MQGREISGSQVDLVTGPLHLQRLVVQEGNVATLGGGRGGAPARLVAVFAEQLVLNTGVDWVGWGGVWGGGEGER